MIIKSNAKINLTLDIIGKRTDGYHLIRSIMQPIPLNDTLKISEGTAGITINCNLPYIPTDERNLVHKAANLFFEKTSMKKNIHIEVEKTIPVGAGLGGGSSNAAAILVSLNEHFKTGMPNEQLCEMGLSLGADVPFFISNHTQLAEGIGERLTEVSPMPACELILIMPPFSINTKWAYSQLKNLDVPYKTDKMIKALEGGDIKEVAKCLGNQFEDVISNRYQMINIIKQDLMKYGALGSAMTGSGSAVYGIFEKDKDINYLIDEFKKFSCFIMTI